MRVLIISSECWRDDSNGGNVLSNLFSGIDGIEFAQIYCKGGLPQNNICKNYYRMNDGMALKAILKHKSSFGEVLNYDDYPMNPPTDSEKDGFYNFFRLHDWPIFFVARDILWKISPYKSDKLRKFILDFNPDLIFAPCYASLSMLALDRWAKSIVDIPMISYISDDNYSLKQMRFDPIYWVYRLMIRHSIRKTSKLYNYMYTMTEQQAQEMSKELHIEMPILRKGVEIIEKERTYTRTSKNKQVKFIYAGGTYLGRDKILYRIAKALQELKDEGVLDYKFDVYTNSLFPDKYQNILNFNIHKSITSQELAQRYLESDFAFHVESFDRKYAYQTRLSFSTKIVDCLGSGCTTIAVCPSLNAGWQYLKANNAAYCIDDIEDVKNELRKLLTNDLLRDSINKNAKKCLIENHDINLIRQRLYKDFYSVVNTGKGNNNEGFTNK